MSNLCVCGHDMDEHHESTFCFHIARMYNYDYDFDRSCIKLCSYDFDCSCIKFIPRSMVNKELCNLLYTFYQSVKGREPIYTDEFIFNMHVIMDYIRDREYDPTNYMYDVNNNDCVFEFLKRLTNYCRAVKQ